MPTLYSERVVLGTRPLRVVPATVVTNGADIVAVHEGERLPGAQDLGRRLIAPAFVNAHTHLPMSAYRGIESRSAMGGNVVEDLYFALEEHVTPADIRAFTRMGAYESLLSGVGCVWEHYYGGEALVDGLRDVGVGAVVAHTLQDINGPGADQWEAQLACTVEHSADDILVALGPHATDTVSSALFEKIRDVAEARDIPIHLHVAQSIEEYERSVQRHGCSPVERLAREGLLAAGPGVMLVHGLYVSDEDLALLEPERNVLGFCPYSQLQFDFPAKVAAWQVAGAGVALGTDAGACNDTMDVQQELRLYANENALGITYGAEHRVFRRDASLDRARAVHSARTRSWELRSREWSDLLSAVWSVPGTLHPKLRCGEIAAGMRANIAVWDLDHPALWPGEDALRALVMGQTSGALWGLLVNGEWRGTPGDMRRSLLDTDTFRAHREEASRRVAEVAKRAGV